MSKYFTWITLFLSTGTLLCCALPILLVSLGFGSFVAAAFYNIESLSFIAEHKFWTLSISFLFLLLLAWIIYRPNQSCPVNKEQGALCSSSKNYNKIIFVLSSMIWLVGFFFAVVLLPLKIFLGV